MTAKRSERILGPYKHHSGWQVIRVYADGSRGSTILPTEKKAGNYKEILIADLAKEEHTTESAFEDYKRHLADKGTQQQSIDVTEWALGQFFPAPAVLHLLSAKRCEALYENLRARPRKCRRHRECTCINRPVSVDTHRNVLAQTRSFLAWCVERGWLRENPLAVVKGIGKRRPRGKSLGKAGNTLRVKEARAWYVKALELAERGDQGAIAGLVAMLLGMRASEIVSRLVSDLDEDAAPGDLLWIPCSKTPAGRRTLEVPEVLRALLVARCEGKATTSYLFEAEDGKPHWRDWILKNVRRICDLASVPEITAHALRGLVATMAAERGLAGHLIAATLGHEDERTTMHSYAAPGAAAAGDRRRGLIVLNGGVSKSA